MYVYITIKLLSAFEMFNPHMIINPYSLILDHIQKFYFSNKIP